MLDPVVHAALVTLMTWLVNWLFGLIGLNLGSEVITGLATVLVGYILSLFGLGVYNRIFFNVRGVVREGAYKPPFT
jgi:hypothetical protein